MGGEDDDEGWSFVASGGLVLVQKLLLTQMVQTM